MRSRQKTEVNPLPVVISCEHGGNRIPAAYRSFFKKQNPTLNSHRGLDIGALDIAKRLSANLRTDFHSCLTSRLLIDLNRSSHHQKLFSEFTSSLQGFQKEALIEQFYKPYRHSVELNLKEKMRQHRQPIAHFSIHSFTPRLNGKKRNCDVGLLYDPRRKNERVISLHLKRELTQRFPSLKVRMNHPYRGRADGLTTWFRGKWPDRHYLGIEIELNQSLLKRLQRCKKTANFVRELSASISCYWSQHL